MMKLFLKIMDVLFQHGDLEEVPRDPLLHPALLAMSERELADLPLSAGYGRKPGDCQASV